MKGDARISPIYRMADTSAPVDPVEHWGRIERLRRRAWQSAGVVSISPAELPEPLGSELKRWAEESYGKR